VVETVKTEFGARNMALDPENHKLFIDTADFGPAPAPTADNRILSQHLFPELRLLVYGR